MNLKLLVISGLFLVEMKNIESSNNSIIINNKNNSNGNKYNSTRFGM